MSGPEHRSGFVAIVGRPNVGKSTLTNALVGHKVAIVSSKPQTTRRAIRGIVHRPHGQLVLVDTPGIHRPRTLLGQRLNQTATEALNDVDAIVMCVPADEKVGPGDRFIHQAVMAAPRPAKFAIVTKTDQAGGAEVASRLLELQALGGFDTFIPVSALQGEQLDVLADQLIAAMPLGPALYPTEQSVDDDVDVRISEYIREAALEGVRDELPHSIAVVVDEKQRREDGLWRIFATIVVERESQKAIVIGRAGSRLKTIGTTAREQIQKELGSAVYLSLHVSVLSDWQGDPKKLRRLGF